MNDQQLDQKVRKDADRVRKDINTLVQDSIARLGRVESSLSKSTGKTRGDLTTWAEEGVSTLSKGFEKLTGDALETADDTAKSVRKDVEHQLNQYNAKIKKIARRAPGDFGKKAARFPWAAISIGLFVGFLVGMIFRPAPQAV